MAVGSQNLDTVTLSAASGMSASSQQFCFVQLTSGSKVHPVTSNTAVPLGVVQNSPALNEAAVVALCGITKVRVSATDIAVDARIGSDDTGRAIALTAGTSTGFYAVGRVLFIDAVDNDGALVTAIIDCENPARNA